MTVFAQWEATPGQGNSRGKDLEGSLRGLSGILQACGRVGEGIADGLGKCLKSHENHAEESL
jgi:hypothetical protein